MPHLIDTDILVDYLRHIEAAANYLDSIADWSVSVVTGLELIAGAKDKREVAEIDLVLGAYHVVPTNAEIGQLAYNDVSTMTAFAFSMTKKIFSMTKTIFSTTETIFSMTEKIFSGAEKIFSMPNKIVSRMKKIFSKTKKIIFKRESMFFVPEKIFS